MTISMGKWIVQQEFTLIDTGICQRQAEFLAASISYSDILFVDLRDASVTSSQWLCYQAAHRCKHAKPSET